MSGFYGLFLIATISDPGETMNERSLLLAAFKAEVEAWECMAESCDLQVKFLEAMKLLPTGIPFKWMLVIQRRRAISEARKNAASMRLRAAAIRELASDEWTDTSAAREIRLIARQRLRECADAGLEMHKLYTQPKMFDSFSFPDVLREAERWHHNLLLLAVSCFNQACEAWKECYEDL